MKKMAILMAAALLCACSASVKKEAVSENGDEEIKVEVEMNGEDVVSVSIDETEGGVSKWSRKRNTASSARAASVRNGMNRSLSWKGIWRSMARRTCCMMSRGGH